MTGANEGAQASAGKGTGRALDFALSTAFGDFELDARARWPAEGITALFGPSGAGKSSLLRALAGFDSARGHVRLGSQTWLDTASGVRVPAHGRAAGLLFQDARLFAHLDVAGNLRYAQRRGRSRATRIDFAAVVEALALADLLVRPVARLSGGERQRVALGRTLLSQPKLLLLDEPFAALDAARKAELLPYVARLGEFGLPAVLVSHDVDEVVRLADRVAVMAAGRILHVGPTRETLARLDVQRLTEDAQSGSVLEGALLAQDDEYGLSRVSVAGCDLVLPRLDGLRPGESVRLRVLARDVAIALQAPGGISIRNVVPARIELLEGAADAAQIEVSLRVGDQMLLSRITRAASVELDLRVGMDVFALVKTVTFDR
ncbi:MAG: molybdenum ABC transporter ATP-binding protein [Pseudomonadota bacterium]